MITSKQNWRTMLSLMQTLITSFVCPFSSPEPRILWLRMTRGSGKLCRSLAKIWLVGSHGACSKSNEKDACSRVSQSSSLPQSWAKEKSSGVEIVLGPESKALYYLSFQGDLFISTHHSFKTSVFLHIAWASTWNSCPMDGPANTFQHWEKFSPLYPSPSQVHAIWLVICGVMFTDQVRVSRSMVSAN